MMIRVHGGADLRTALADRGLTATDDAAHLVFDVTPRHEWGEARADLVEAFGESKRSAEKAGSVVYVVSLDALLGRIGASAAMAAAGIVSASRTLSLELKRAGGRSNVLAVSGQTDAATVATWVAHLLADDPGGPSGEVIHLGGTQVGKALS